MKIIALMENTVGADCCIAAHGLSFYIQTEKHRLLMDAGPSGQTVKNAEELGVDLSNVDIAVLSHGHYDHADGFSEFLKVNSSARIYMQKTALDGYYAVDDGKRRYIGIDEKLKTSERLALIDGNYVIDDELMLFTGINGRREFPFTNKRLFKEEGGSFVNDDFVHEQCLVVSQNGKRVLFSGCAHNGVLNVLDRFSEICGGEPDLVVSGFHLSKKTDYTEEDILKIRQTAQAMKNYNTRFFTCHCTGEFSYRIMKDILGGKLGYIRCGEQIKLD